MVSYKQTDNKFEDYWSVQLIVLYYFTESENYFRRAILLRKQVNKIHDIESEISAQMQLI